MNLHDTEICGFLDVKSMGHRYIAQKARKKTFMLSKVWKRLWCSIKKLRSDLGVQVQFDTKLSCSSSALKQSEKSNSVIIPPSAIIYRIRSRTKQFAFGISPAKDKKPLLSLSANSETETQRWMANIRHLLKPRRHCCTEKSYDVSMVDNVHSKAAGLIGLYGNLIANETGIFIRDVHTSEIIKTFEWKEFSQFHLMTAGRPEDVKRICVIHTTKEFCCDIGELYVFCLNANKLLQDLVTQGRGPKHKQKSLNFNDETLKALTQHEEINNSSSQLKNNAQHTLNTETDCLRTSTSSTENIHQTEPNSIPNEEMNSCNHKELNTSIASGIYEEIMDDICCPKTTTFVSNVYEDTDKILHNLRMEPPALPPRQREKSKHIEENRMYMRQHSHSKISKVLKTKVQNTKICMQETTLIDNSNYVPMSPQLRNNISESDVIENSKENDYVIMQ